MWVCDMWAYEIVVDKVRPEQQKNEIFAVAFSSSFSLYYILRRTIFREIIPIFMDHVGYIYTVT